MNRKLKYALGALAVAGYGFAAVQNPALIPGFVAYVSSTVQQMTSQAPAAQPASAPAATSTAGQ
ncbi:hypothetical protein 8G_00037 [Ralstonia phage Hyacinthe]|uniref:Uncharacterized protein n=3 Tax=Rahariannevirus raharianne TaxID=2846050 RepID=A0A7G5BBF2_9CAUD|nr:hypothetical protein KMC43_gp56 [Ralstonia phage Raharianne]QMV32431.1 hypothetical protein U2_00056 [Ralstonia phage Albius]QMV33469.1 hypothetical protein 8G_00037 [Ralstonia phage Hyacinthe]QMV33625.1 hypothetical protein Y2_00056 [Ralstonia phage Raharianne]